MYYAFLRAYEFNSDVSKWDVSEVTNMQSKSVTISISEAVTWTDNCISSICSI